MAVTVLESQMTSMSLLEPPFEDVAVGAIIRSVGRCLFQMTGLLVLIATLGTDTMQRTALMSITWWAWIMVPATFVLYPIDVESFAGGYFEVGTQRYLACLGVLAWVGHGLLDEDCVLHPDLHPTASETALLPSAGARRLAKGLRVHGIVSAVLSCAGIFRAGSIPDLAKQPTDVARALVNIFANVEVMSMVLGYLMIAASQNGTVRLQRAAALWTLANMWILLPLLYFFYPTANGFFLGGVPPALLVSVSVHSIPLVWGLMSKDVFRAPQKPGLALP